MKLEYVDDNFIYKVNSELAQWDQLVVQISSQPEGTGQKIMTVLEDNGTGVVKGTVGVQLDSRVGRESEFSYMGTAEDLPEYFL